MKKVFSVFYVFKILNSFTFSFLHILKYCCCLQRLAIRILTKGRAPLHITKEMQVKIGKCSESMWKLTYYATVEAFILKITYQEPWFSNTKLYFNDWPNHELK